ncbi:tRNA1(Val) (adenine(37)-N6)-methyltransferase [Acetobacter sp. AN02]|uniref:tRNA1(Val) (adenine(37)-N6)-methyltransferase n=1 Tax=Acetobacter sp. AN02 TaxID=2894186 RepID=UPI0038D07BF6
MTSGTLLDGRIPYTQFRQGNRTGFEPVFMAAAVPARRGERVLEAGCGAGAGLLCLASRISDLHGTGVEADAATAALAERNIRDAATAGLNTAGLRIVQDDLLRPDSPLLSEPLWHHAFANPPWHPWEGTASEVPRRDLARRAPPDTVSGWVAALSRLVRERGTLTLALPPARLGEALAACAEHRLGSACIFPLWPGSGREARIILVRARAGGRGGVRLHAGLVLHDEAGGLSPAAERVLRGGEALQF